MSDFDRIATEDATTIETLMSDDWTDILVHFELSDGRAFGGTDA